VKEKANAMNLAPLAMTVAVAFVAEIAMLLAWSPPDATPIQATEAQGLEAWSDWQARCAGTKAAKRARRVKALEPRWKAARDLGGPLPGSEPPTAYNK
jgi:hypothetical protein